MGLQTAFDVLSQIVEQYESRGRTVRHVEATASDGGSLQVSMAVPVSLCAASGDGVHSDLTPETATLTDSGGLRVEFSTSALAALPPTTAASISVNEEAVRVEDGGIVLGVELTVDPSADGTERAAVGEDAATDSRTTAQSATEPTDVDGASPEPSAPPADSEDASLADELAAVRDDDVPPYEDTAYLKRLYDACENFTEMSERIEMDVSSETVRRYMIEADIHDPTSYDTSTNQDTGRAGEGRADATTSAEPTLAAPTATDDPMETIPDEQLVTDGLGLPESVHLADVADAVVDSVTVYEVQRHLDLERQQTQELLEELNLLDLVMRQLSDNPEQTASYEQVATRIRECAPGPA
ncbi:hypothetical protein [Haloarcula pellucida]|uniref:Uncharacterized protein n=1 Tax=Haloarcula pellucida TaxID=1427151 RepID=A0A830GKC1_9EURY|nr:hypothetical protein [Halomicroarcula pellucida]MBX0349846.1 hypothetical protein [Halomicroarcula pellucida]GGN94626.1 hypothetical protein GCM10009030_21170 [Halomicroarcula pellucida]